MVVYGVEQHELKSLQIPSFLLFVFSVCLWFSVNDFWPGRVDMIHFPLIYIGIVGVILFNPLKLFFGSARMYFLTTLVGGSLKQKCIVGNEC